MRYLTPTVALGAVIAFGAAQAAPLELDPLQLDGITAGSAGEHTSGEASGGAIVGNGSSADINLSGSVSLDSNAQEGTKALNLVNSSESTVANGANIWDGRLETTGNFSDGANYQIDQQNMIQQEQRRVASMPVYNRPDANTETQWDDASSSMSDESYDLLDTVNNTVTTRSETRTETDGSVDTSNDVLGQEFKGGRGLAGSGEINVDFDGGAVDFAIEGQIQLFDGGPAAQASLTLGIELPEFTVDIDGSGCAVMAGSCTASGSTENIEDSSTDNSTHYALTTSSSSSSEESSVGSSSTRSAFFMEGAQAEYIVVDESQIIVNSDFSVTLAGSAQQNTQAMNLVNAAGSAVANGVNVAVTRAGELTTSGQMLHLTQSNVIVHSR